MKLCKLAFRIIMEVSGAYICTELVSMALPSGLPMPVRMALKLFGSLIGIEAGDIAADTGITTFKVVADLIGRLEPV